MKPPEGPPQVKTAPYWGGGNGGNNNGRGGNGRGGNNGGDGENNSNNDEWRNPVYLFVAIWGLYKCKFTG